MDILLSFRLLAFNRTLDTLVKPRQGDVTANSENLQCLSQYRTIDFIIFRTTLKCHLKSPGPFYTLPFLWSTLVLDL